jgi:hypothetical protein
MRRTPYRPVQITDQAWIELRHCVVDYTSRAGRRLTSSMVLTAALQVARHHDAELLSVLSQEVDR